MLNIFSNSLCEEPTYTDLLQCIVGFYPAQAWDSYYIITLISLGVRNQAP